MLSAGAEKRSQEILGNLSEQDKNLLIALPYRVGMYVSQSDETGGDQAQMKEFETLMNILTGISEDFCKSEIMQKILQETVAHKDRWREWNANLDEVPDECRRGLECLEGRVDQRTDLLSVRDTLIDIGIAIGMAFRENDGGAGSMVDAVKDTARNVLGSFIPSMAKDERFAHLNISTSERAALEKVAKAMDI